jgi:hypothetical protein
MNTPYRQRGLSSLAWLTVFVAAGFFVTCGIKLFPIYLNGWTVDSIISKAIEKGELKGKTPGQIKGKLGKYFDTNRVDGINARDLKVMHNRKAATIEIDATFEQRLPLMYNVDVVVKHDKLIYSFPVTGN